MTTTDSEVDWNKRKKVFYLSLFRRQRYSGDTCLDPEDIPWIEVPLCLFKEWAPIQEKNGILQI